MRGPWSEYWAVVFGVSGVVWGSGVSGVVCSMSGIFPYSFVPQGSLGKP